MKVISKSTEKRKKKPSTQVQTGVSYPVCLCSKAKIEIQLPVNVASWVVKTTYLSSGFSSSC